MDQQNINTMRHSLAHIMAAAIKELHPEAKLGVGPVTEDGFYYDILPGKQLSLDDLEKIEEKMHEIVRADYAFEKEEMSIERAIEYFGQKKQDFKVELLRDLQKSGSTRLKDIRLSDVGVESKKDRVDVVSVYKTGDFVDLCRGPHLERTSQAGAFKLTKIAGAYWRGDETKPQMQRIYGVAFTTDDEMEKYFERLEEAKKRDHRALGEKLKIFFTSDEVGSGLPMLLPRGEIIKKILMDYMRDKEEKRGYQFVSTPVIAHESLYQKSGHTKYYSDDMYKFKDREGSCFYIKPMNCPHHHMIYQKMVTSYRDLPLILAEQDGLYRHELSGTLTGLIRVRGPITQNDAHIYVTSEQLKQEFLKVLDLFSEVYQEIGIKDWWFRLSLPDFSSKDQKYVGNKDSWQNASKIIREALEEYGAKFVESEGEAAFYGPKLDVQSRNVLGKEDTIATVQVDILVPANMGLSYVDSSGERQTPLVIHRAILGSYERFIAFLLEQTAGNLPFWLAPEQIRILPISIKFSDYANKIYEKIKQAGLRVGLDDSAESLGKRIRNAELVKIPYIIVIGEKEEKGNVIALRHYDKGDIGTQTVDNFITLIKKSVDQKKH